MNLTTQKRLAASILKVGVNRVWIDPDEIEEVSRAITRDGIKQLIDQGIIKAKPKTGISSYRSKKIKEQKKKGKRKGRGSIKGAKNARTPKKQVWMKTIRALRTDLKDMRDAGEIDRTTYRKLYKMAKGGAFRSKSYMKTYARDHDLIKYVRISNANCIVQVINVGKDGDETVVSAHSKELNKLGWLAGNKNTSAVYLTAYLCGKKAVAAGIDYAVADIGLKSPIRGSKVFAAVKGAADAGLNVPYGESIIPTEDRINGEHIAEYAESLDEEELNKKFSQYLAKGLQPTDLPEHFEEIKNKIDEAEL